MSKLTDQGYLLSDQYQDASNLDARIELHRRFSINKTGWMRWVFDQFSFQPASRILELGCGPGALWVENLERVPQGWHVTLSDLSPGMVQKAQSSLQGSHRRFEYRVIDAQEIPFEDESLDGVIANHMLYHVPDMHKALSEMRRVLRPGGRFYATTVGGSHLRELYDLISRFAGRDDLWDTSLPAGFSLENGAELLSRHFSQVTLRRYEDGLVITAAAPLVAYVHSMMIAESVLRGTRSEAFARFVESELAASGAIVVTKDSGMFEAVRGA